MSSIRPVFKLGWVNHLRWSLICVFENGLFDLLYIKSSVLITRVYYLVSENQIAVGTEVSLDFQVVYKIIDLLIMEVTRESQNGISRKNWNSRQPRIPCHESKHRVLVKQKITLVDLTKSCAFFIFIEPTGDSFNHSYSSAYHDLTDGWGWKFDLMSIAVWSVVYMFFFSASGCLALAELGRRGLLLPDRLPEGLPKTFICQHLTSLYYMISFLSRDAVRTKRGYCFDVLPNSHCWHPEKCKVISKGKWYLERTILTAFTAVRTKSFFKDWGFFIWQVQCLIWDGDLKFATEVRLL